MKRSGKGVFGCGLAQLAVAAAISMASVSVAFGEGPESSALTATPVSASAWRLSLHGGPSSPDPLFDLIKFKSPNLKSYWLLAFAVNHRLTPDAQTLAWEAEAQLSQFLESSRGSALQLAGLARWLPLPWDKVVETSFATGLGLSFAREAPAVEREQIGKSSATLLHLLFEFAVELGGPDREAFFRIHHRSGIFGLFDGVVGGSDFLCLGFRLGV